MKYFASAWWYLKIRLWKKIFKKNPLQVFRGDICGCRHSPWARLSVSSFHLMLGSEQDFPNNFQSKVTPRRWYGNFKASGVMDYCPNHLWRHKAPNNETNSVKPSGRPIFGRRCFMYQQSDLKIWKKYNSSMEVTLRFSWNYFHGKFRELDFTTK